MQRARCMQSSVNQRAQCGGGGSGGGKASGHKRVRVVYIVFHGHVLFKWPLTCCARTIHCLSLRARNTCSYGGHTFDRKQSGA